MEETKNELIIKDFNELESKRRSKTDVFTTLTDAKTIFNLDNSTDYKLNDCIGQTITVIGATIGEYPNETTNEETGEVIIRKKHSLCLFDENGKSYVTGSGNCYYSFVGIITLKGMPTKDKPLKLEVVNVPAETKGHNYLKLKIAK